MNRVIGAVSERLGQLGNAGDPDAEPAVVRHVHLGDGRQPAVDTRVRADHVDVVAGDSVLAETLDCVAHPVHRADRVDDQRDPLGLAVAGGELALFRAQDRHRRHVGNGRDHRIEQRQGRVLESLAGLGDALHLADGVAQLSLVRAARLAIEVRVAEAVLLHQLDQLARIVGKAHRVEPGAKERRHLAGVQAGRRLPAANRPVADDPLSDLEHGRRAAAPLGEVLRIPKERARGERKRGVGPLGCAALRSVGHGEPAPHVVQKLFRGRRGRRLGPGPPDVHPGVVVRSADARAAVGLDVDGRRHVQLASPRPVANLPDSEELRQPAPVARLQGLRDFEEGMRECARDPVLVQVRSARLDVERVAL